MKTFTVTTNPKLYIALTMYVHTRDLNIVKLDIISLNQIKTNIEKILILL